MALILNHPILFTIGLAFCPRVMIAVLAFKMGFAALGRFVLLVALVWFVLFDV